MQKKTHIASGILLIQFFYIFIPDLFKGINIVAALLISIIFSQFPDIDLKTPLKHRGITHYPILYLIILALSIYFAKSILLIFAALCLLHIMLDFFNVMGICLFAPFSNKRYSLKLFVSGGFFDNILFIVLFISIIVLIFKYPKIYIL